MLDTISIEKIKEDFTNFRTWSCKIRKKKEELAVVKSKLGNPHGVKLSDIPKTVNPHSDRTLYLIQEKIEIESEIKKLNKKRDFERKRLNKILKNLDSTATAKLVDRKPEALTAEASILRLRYFCGFSWDEINDAFYGEDEDFNVNADVYLKRIFRYHGQAFIDLQKIAKFRSTDVQSEGLNEVRQCESRTE